MKKHRCTRNIGKRNARANFQKRKRSRTLKCYTGQHFNANGKNRPSVTPADVSAHKGRLPAERRASSGLLKRIRGRAGGNADRILENVARAKK